MRTKQQTKKRESAEAYTNKAEEEARAKILDFFTNATGEGFTLANAYIPGLVDPYVNAYRLRGLKPFQGAAALFFNGRPGLYATFSEALNMGHPVKKGEKATAAAILTPMEKKALAAEVEAIEENLDGVEVREGAEIALWSSRGRVHYKFHTTKGREGWFRVFFRWKFYYYFEAEQLEGYEAEAKRIKAELHEKAKAYYATHRADGSLPPQRIGYIDDTICTYARADNVTISEGSARTGTTHHEINEAHDFHAAHIIMPFIESYKDTATYYEAFLHEATHSTGGALHRPLGGKFGSAAYAREELVAETGAAFLMHVFGISTDGSDKRAAEYLKNWALACMADKDGGAQLEKAFNQASAAIKRILTLGEWSADNTPAQSAQKQPLEAKEAKAGQMAEPTPEEAPSEPKEAPSEDGTDEEDEDNPNWQLTLTLEQLKQLKTLAGIIAKRTNKRAFQSVHLITDERTQTLRACVTDGYVLIRRPLKVIERIGNNPDMQISEAAIDYALAVSKAADKDKAGRIRFTQQTRDALQIEAGGQIQLMPNRQETRDCFPNFDRIHSASLDTLGANISGNLKELVKALKDIDTLYRATRKAETKRAEGHAEISFIQNGITSLESEHVQKRFAKVIRGIEAKSYAQEIPFVANQLAKTFKVLANDFGSDRVEVLTVKPDENKTFRTKLVYMHNETNQAEALVCPVRRFY